MTKIDIGDFCFAMESALNALGYLIIKTDEVSGEADLSEFNSLAFARDATMRRAKELLSEFSSTVDSSKE